MSSFQIWPSSSRVTSISCSPRTSSARAGTPTAAGTGACSRLGFHFPEEQDLAEGNLHQP